MKGQKKNPAAIPFRFWTKVDVRGPDDCWNWKASCDKDGYGKFYPNSPYVEKDWQSVSASKMAYLLHAGVQTVALHVLHQCDNRKYCNPGHLFLGTHQDNMADMLTKRRNRKSQAA